MLAEVYFMIKSMVKIISPPPSFSRYKPLTHLFIVYIIFYGNWSSTEAQQEQTIFMNFIDNISASPWFNLCRWNLESFYL